MDGTKTRVSRYLDRPITRRQAVKIGSLAAMGLVFSKPIIETIRPKPAFAAYVGQEGCTPGYWKNHLSDWAPTGYDPADLFQEAFGVPDSVIASYPDSLLGKTLLEVLKQGGGCDFALGRHAVAALLNASHPDVAYGLTEQDVKDLVKAALALPVSCGRIESTKDDLEGLNEASCPLGGKAADNPPGPPHGHPRGKTK